MIQNEIDLLNTLKAREARAETRGRFAGGRLHGWPNADQDDAVPSVNPNRARYIASLEAKRASTFKTEGERVREAEQIMARNREEARQQLLHGGGLGASHPAGTTQARVLKALAESAEAAGRSRREAAEARAWRTQAAQREARRQRMVAKSVGGEIGAAERALRSIARNAT